MNGLIDGLLMAYLWIDLIYQLIYGLLILFSATSWPYRFILGILFGSRLMAHGSRLMAHDSWLMAHDSWLMAHGSWPIKKLARGPPGPGPSRQIFDWP